MDCLKKMSINSDLKRIHFLMNFSNKRSLNENISEFSFNKILIVEEYPYSDLKNNPSAELIAKVIKDSWGTVNDYEAWAEAAFATIWTKEMHDKVRDLLGIKYPNRVIDYLRKFMDDSEFKKKFRTKPIWDHEQYLLGLEKQVGNYGAGKGYPYNILQDQPTAANIAKVIKDSKGSTIFSNDKEAWAEAAFFAIKDHKTHEEVRKLLGLLNSKRVIDFFSPYMDDDELKRKWHVKPIWEHEQYLLGLAKEEEKKRENEDLKKKEECEKSQYTVWDPKGCTRKIQWFNKSGGIEYETITFGCCVDKTPENANLSKVPLGFHKDEYQEYLNKLTELRIKKDKCEKESLAQMGSRPPSDYLGAGGQFERDNQMNCTGQFIKDWDLLKKEYYHKEFPFGITKEAYASYLEATRNAEEAKQLELSKIRGPIDHFSQIPGSDYFQSVRAENKKKIDMSRTADVIEKYKGVQAFFDAIYERDPYFIDESLKTEWDKTWEKWGIVIELMGWILADVAAQGIIKYYALPRQMTLLAKLLDYGVKYGLPIAVGTFRTINAGYLTPVAVVDYCFALLPWLHRMFGLAKAPSVRTVEDMMQMMKGVNLQNVDEVMQLVRSFNQEQKLIFQQVMTKNHDQLSNILKVGTEDLAKLVKKNYKMADTLKNSDPLKLIYPGIARSLNVRDYFIKPSILAQGGKALAMGLFIDLPFMKLAEHLASEFGFLNYYDKLEKIKAEFKGLKGISLMDKFLAVYEVLIKNPQIVPEKIPEEVAKRYPVIKNMVDLNEKYRILIRAWNGILTFPNGKCMKADGDGKLYEVTCE